MVLIWSYVIYLSSVCMLELALCLHVYLEDSNGILHLCLVIWEPACNSKKLSKYDQISMHWICCCCYRVCTLCLTFASNWNLLSPSQQNVLPMLCTCMLWARVCAHACSFARCVSYPFSATSFPSPVLAACWSCMSTLQSKRTTTPNNVMSYKQRKRFWRWVAQQLQEAALLAAERWFSLAICITAVTSSRWCYDDVMTTVAAIIERVYLLDVDLWYPSNAIS